MDILTFPCLFPIKLFVKAPLGNFAHEVTAELTRQLNQPPTITQRASRSGHYLALTVTIEPQSQSELDGVYCWLSQHERVVMAL